MKKILISLVAILSFSTFAQSSDLERVAKVVSEYTPFSATTIVSNENLLNKPILNNYVAGEFYGNLSHDLAIEFGECARNTLWEREDISIFQLSEVIGKQCKH